MRVIGDKLVIATHNPGKLREIAALIEPLGIACVGAEELGLPEPEEIGNNFADNAAWFRGKHNLKLGYELYRISMERGAANLEEGRYTFSGNESGQALASFLMGYPTSTESAEGLPLTFPVSTRWGAYVHDDWKVSPRLTLELGIRITRFPPWSDNLGYGFSVFDYSKYNSSCTPRFKERDTR